MRYQPTKNLLYLTIFSAPLYVIRFHIGPFPTTFLEILILLTVLSWVLESRFWISLPRRQAGQNDRKDIFKKTSYQAIKLSRFYDLPFTIYCLPILLLILAAIISTIISPDEHGALGTLKAYIIEPILIYIIIKNVIKTKEDAKKLIAVMIASGVFVGLWVIAQAAFGWFITNPTEAMLGRAHGPYNTANAVGLYLGPILAIIIARIKNSEFRSQNLLFFCFSVLLFSAILLSHSTGALIATTVVIFLFFLNNLTIKQFNNLFGLRFTCPQCKAHSFGRRAIYELLIYCLLSLIFIFLIIPHLTPKTSWTTTRPESYTTATIRLCLWEGTRNMLLDKPIFGAGLSGFKELYAQKYTTCDAEPLEYPHNLILNFWTEMGILGVISFMWLIGKVFNDNAPTCHSELVSESRCTGPETKKMLNRVQHDSVLRMGITLALIYILIHGLVDVPYFKNDLSLQFWLLLAISSIRFS